MKTRAIIILMICFNVSMGQVTKFQKIFSGESIPVPPYTMSDLGYSIANTTDSGYIIGGSHGKYAGFNYMYGKVIKLDQNGDAIWTSIVGDGTTNATWIHATIETSDNGFISVGVTQFFNYPYYDIILTKFNNIGNLLWTKIFGGASNIDRGLDVLETDDGDFVIAGYTQAYGAGGRDAYVIKTNSVGDTIWSRIIGGTGNEEARSIHLTADKGFIITGYTSSYGAGGDDGLMFKLDSIGNLLWSKTYGNMGDEYIASCVILPNDTIVFAGSSNNDFFLAKTTPNGDTLWTKHIGTLGTDVAFDIAATNDNGFAITGYTLGGPPGVPNMYVVKTDYKGDTLWIKAYGESGGDEAYSIIETPDSGLALIGYTNILPGENDDYYIVKTDAIGQSGCHEYSTASFVNNISTQINLPSPQITSGSDTASPSFTIINATRITTECFTVGITENNVFGTYRLYPNPTEQYTTLEFDNSKHENYTLALYDIHGRLVRTITNITTDNLTIDTGDLSDGLYFFQLYTDRQINLTGKVIKREKK